MATTTKNQKKGNGLLLFAVVSALVFGGIFVGAKLYSQQAQVAAAPSPAPQTAERKVGVMLVSHGSHSQRWRDMLFAVEESVRDEVLAAGDIHAVQTAFMEYTEPSIATRLEEFDQQGCTDVIVVPLLLTVSSHSFDDIPTLCGLKEDAASLAALKAEGARIYKPAARVHMTPLLDFPALLEANVVRRARALSTQPGQEGAVLVAYGDAEYNTEWEALMGRLQQALARELKVSRSEFAWCGHIAHYKKEPTIEAIRTVLADKQRALVVPILVSVDEAFQYRIIGGAVQDVNAGERVAYIPDAILPEPELDQWIIEIVRSTRVQLQSEGQGHER